VAIFFVRPAPVRGHITAMPAAHPFTFICGADDFLVGRLGQQRFDALAANVADEFSREVLNGFAGNVGEVESAINRFRESVQTVSMFGGQRVVWLKDVNFLADTVTGRAEGTLTLVEDLQQILAAVNPADTAVLITAAPVDRRRSFPKWCEKTADFTLVGGGEDDGEALAGVVLAEAQAVGATLSPDAVRLLLAKVGANTRLLVEEVRKLAAYVNAGETIEEAQVAELTPNTAEGDFFEAAEAFFSGNLKWTLAALQRHFFAGNDARPVIAALQNRNRILLQVRALVDAGDVRVGPRGLEGLPKAQAAHAAKFTGAPEKSSFNLFSQNPWYLGKLAGSAKLPGLRRLIDNQQEFIAAFEEIINRPHEQEEVLREMTVRCLAVA
jgi:DNA polymerase-3 subunit delta